MPPQTASCVFVLLMVGLFWLDRDQTARVSKALFLPLLLLWWTSSRSLTEWVAIAGFGSSPDTTQANMYMDGTPLDRNVLIVLIVLAIVILVRRGCLGTLVRANLPIILFLAYGAASVIWSDYPDVTIRRWFKGVGTLLVVMIVLSERDREAAMKRLFVWAGFLLIPHSVLLIKYYPAIGRKYIIANLSTWLLSPVGVTTHKNSLGGLCQVYGIVFLWCFLVAYRNRELSHRIRHLIAHGTALVMVAWLFIQANSVTAQSCFILAAAFLLATSFRTIARKQWLVNLLVLALIAIPFATLFLGIGGSALQGMGRDSTLTGRTVIWQHVIALVEHPMIGTGFESFWLGKRLEIMQEYQRSLNESHNGYVEIWASLGWIGVILLVVMIVTGYRNIMISYRRNPDTGRLKLAFFVTVIVSSFTEAVFKTDSISWLALLLIGMAGSESWSRESVRSLGSNALTSKQVRVEPVALEPGPQQLILERAVPSPTPVSEADSAIKPLSRSWFE